MKPLKEALISKDKKDWASTKPAYTPCPKAQRIFNNYIAERTYARMHYSDPAYTLDDDTIKNIKYHYKKEIKSFVNQIDLAIETYSKISNKKEEQLWIDTFDF